MMYGLQKVCKQGRDVKLLGLIHTREYRDVYYLLHCEVIRSSNDTPSGHSH